MNEAIVRKILKKRGRPSIVAIYESDAVPVTEAAKAFGLFPSPDIYREINAKEARAVLASVLHKDMAYGVKIMSAIYADQLARDFVNVFLDEKTTFYTNGRWGRPPCEGRSGISWSPATKATFDTGVIAITPTRIGCAWFMDED